MDPEGKMAGRLPMGQKEVVRSKMLEMVKQGKLTLKAAVVTMRVSYRQGIRLYAAYRKEGDAGLIHGNCGRESNNRLAEGIRGSAIKVYREKYPDFGPTFAKEYRSRRERRPRFGELIQFDGRHYKWFEERGPSCCLMTMIDDATNTRMERFFV